MKRAFQIIAGILLLSTSAYATVSDNRVLKRVDGDGATEVFTFSFDVLSVDDLTVYILEADGDLVTQTEGTDFDLTINSGGGGSIDFTTAPASTEDVIMLGNPQRTQVADFPREGLLDEQALEAAIDRSVLISQSQQEQINRSLKLRVQDNLNTTAWDGLYFEVDSDHADQLIAWDVTGTYIKDAGIDVSDLAGDLADLSSSVSSASASASAASASASAAATSAANAATSETNAATSETNAATSEANAAASEAAINASWLGAWVTSTAYAVGEKVSNGGSSYIATAAHTSGASTEPGVGGSWTTVWDLLAAKGAPGAGTGDLLAANNLSDVANAATSRTNLGLAIGTNVQAYDAELAAIAGLTSAADKGIQFTGSGTAAVYDLTTAGKALIDDASAAAQRTTLGLGSASTLTAGTSANNVVQLDGSAKLPAVDGSALTNLPGGGAWTLIEAQTASSSASIDFDNFDEAACSQVKIVFSDLEVSTTATVYIRTSTNNGSSYDSGASNYFSNKVRDLYTASPTYTPLLTTELPITQNVTTTGDDLYGEIVLYDPSKTSNNKLITAHVVSTSADDSWHTSGYRDSTADIDAIRIDTSAGTIATGNFYLYCLSNT